MVRGGAGLADIAASADGFHVATAGGDGAMTTIDLRTGHIRRAMLGDRVVKGVAFGADGLGLLAAGMAEPYVVIDDEAGGRSHVLKARSLRRVISAGALPPRKILPMTFLHVCRSVAIWPLVRQVVCGG